MTLGRSEGRLWSHWPAVLRLVRSDGAQRVEERRVIEAGLICDVELMQPDVWRWNRSLPLDAGPIEEVEVPCDSATSRREIEHSMHRGRHVPVRIPELRHRNTRRDSVRDLNGRVCTVLV